MSPGNSRSQFLALLLRHCRSTEPKPVCCHVPAIVKDVSVLDRVVAARNIVVQALDFIRVHLVPDFAGVQFVYDGPRRG